MQSNAVKTIIPKSWTVPVIFRQRLGQEVGRQRLILDEGQILVVLHQVPSAADKGVREPALFWYDGAGNWKSMPHSGGCSELKGLVESYRQRLTALDNQLERAVSATDVHAVIDEAAPAARASRHVMQVLSELRKALPEDREVLAIRDMSVQNERTGELVLSDARSSLDFMVAKSAAMQAQEAHKSAQEAQQLNRMAAFFFPLMTIAAVLGMNEPAEMLSSASVWWMMILGGLLGLIVRGVLRRSS